MSDEQRDFKKKGHYTTNVKVNRKILSHGIFMSNIEVLAFTVQKLSARLSFKKRGRTPRLSSEGQKFWYPRKGLVKRNSTVM